MKRFASDRKKFTNTFGKIDFDFMQSFVEVVKNGNDPLDIEPMLPKLIVKGRGTDVDLPIFTYINAAKVIMFGDKSIYQKLAAYEQEKWKEFYDQDSKFRRFITKTRGEEK